MKAFFDHWPTLKKRLERADRVLLLLDYDGTLTPIRQHPSLAVMSGSMRTLLEDLARNPRIIPGIVSGRSLENVEKMVGVDGMVYAGNHGLEIRNGAKTFYAPGVRRSLRYIRQAAGILEDTARRHPCAYFEDKGLSLSLHYRNCSAGESRSLEAEFAERLKPLSGRLRITAGKKVWEIRPPLDWHKGKAVQWILERYSTRHTPLPVYIGDDRTDEDAFKALPRYGLSVYVGRTGGSTASYNIETITGVRKCLKLISQI